MKVIDTYKTGEYDTYKMENGDIVDFRFIPFRRTEETIIEILLGSNEKNISLGMTATVTKEIEIVDGQLKWVFGVKLYNSKYGIDIDEKFISKNSTLNKRVIYNRLLKGIYSAFQRME
jgi:hypothetical protein